MKKRKITTAAFLAGVTTLSVSLPAMAETRSYEAEKAATSTQVDFINGEDFQWIVEES
jgi:hypothetical protein